MSNPFVRNSLIVGRDGDLPPFTLKSDGDITVRLDGYVICPVEKLQEVAARALLAADVDADKPTFPI